MSLKEKINETKNIKPKIETELNNINSVITGGGIVSNTLSEIPNNITTMVTENYNKICIIDFPEPIPIENKKVQLNLKFTPKKLILHVKPFGYSGTSEYLNPIIPEPKTNENKMKLYWGGNCRYYANITTMTATELRWKDYDSVGTYTKGKIHQIIAIG